MLMMEPIVYQHRIGPHQKHLALDKILCSLQQSEDDLSGSECSSFATSPIEEKWQPAFSPSMLREALDDGQNERQSGREREEHHLDEIAEQEPAEIVRELFAHLGDADVVEELLAEGASVEWVSHIESAPEVVSFRQVSTPERAVANPIFRTKEKFRTQPPSQSLQRT